MPSSDRANPARTSHQLPAAAGDAPGPATFARLGVLDVPPSTPPRPSGRKRHWARRLTGFASKPGEKSGLAHVSSIKLLVGVWVALLIGTWLTVSATYVDLGALNIWIGLAIATAKAYLVAAYYMHLRWDRPFNVLVFAGALVFLGLFIGLAITDSLGYQQLLTPPPVGDGGAS